MENLHAPSPSPPLPLPRMSNVLPSSRAPYLVRTRPRVIQRPPTSPQPADGSLVQVSPRLLLPHHHSIHCDPRGRGSSQPSISFSVFVVTGAGGRGLKEHAERGPKEKKCGGVRSERVAPRIKKKKKIDFRASPMRSRTPYACSSMVREVKPVVHLAIFKLQQPFLFYSFFFFFFFGLEEKKKAAIVSYTPYTWSPPPGLLRRPLCPFASLLLPLLYFPSRWIDLSYLILFWCLLDLL